MASNGPSDSVPLGAEILQLIGDMAGAAKAVKGDLAQAKADAKEAEKALKKSGYNDPNATPEQRASGDAAAKRKRDAEERVAALEKKKQELDDKAKAKKDVGNTVGNRIAEYHNWFGSKVVGTIQRIASRGVQVSDLNALGGAAQKVGARLATGGRAGLGGAIGKAGDALSTGAMKVAGIGALAGAVVQAGFSSATEHQQSREQLAKTQGQFFANFTKFLQGQQNKSEFSPQELEKILLESSAAAEKQTKKVLAESPLQHLKQILGFGSLVAQQTGEQFRQRRVQKQRFIDLFGEEVAQGISAEALSDNATVQMLIRREIVKKGLGGTGVLYAIKELTGMDLGLDFVSSTEHAVRAFFGGETRAEIEARITLDAEQNAMNAMEESRRVQVEAFELDPIRRSGRNLMMNQLRGLEEFNILKEGFAQQF